MKSTIICYTLHYVQVTATPLTTKPGPSTMQDGSRVISSRWRLVLFWARGCVLRGAICVTVQDLQLEDVFKVRYILASFSSVSQILVDDEADWHHRNHAGGNYSWLHQRMKSVSNKQADLQEILPTQMLWIRPYLYLPSWTCDETGTLHEPCSLEADYGDME
jgi:hypothetical protein